MTKQHLSKEQLILKGPLTTAILTLALPIMLNNLIASLYNLGDAYWVAKLGDLEVATINFVWPVSFLTFSIAMGISVAGSTMVAQFIGANNEKAARTTAQQLYIFGVLFGLFSSVLGWLVSPAVIRLMNATGPLYDNSVLYLRILFIEMPFLFLMNIFFSLNQATGDTVTPTAVNGASAILNILIDPIFIFVLDMGIAGAAWATVLSKVPFALYGVYRLSTKEGPTHIKLFDLRIDKDKMSELIRIGAPASLGTSGMALGFMVLFSMFASFGTDALTAVSIGNRLNGLAFMPAIGIGAALSTITGQNLGAGNVPRIREAFRRSLLLSTILLAFTCGILGFFPRPLLGIFSQTPGVLNMGSTYLRTLALTTWTIGFFNCALALFNGSGHTKFSMFLEAGRLWLLRMPLILLLSDFLGMGVDGIWYSVGLSNVIAASIAFALTFTGIWKKPNVKHRVA